MNRSQRLMWKSYPSIFLKPIIIHLSVTDDLLAFFISSDFPFFLIGLRVSHAHYFLLVIIGALEVLKILLSCFSVLNIKQDISRNAKFSCQETIEIYFLFETFDFTNCGPWSTQIHLFDIVRVLFWQQLSI